MKNIGNYQKIKKVGSWACCLILILILTNQAWAVKAKPGLIDFTQPDGTTVQIRLYGDEKGHFTTTEDGYLLLMNKEGGYEYAALNEEGKPVLSGVSTSVQSGSLNFEPVKVELNKNSIVLSSLVENTKFSRKRNTSRASGEPKYRYSTSAFPTTGNPHSLVILVEYQDVKFSVEDPLDYFRDLLNGENFVRDNGTGSCKQYFTDNSTGAFSPTYDVYGPILLSHNRAYYGGGLEEYANQMVIESVKQLDDIIDYSQYDHNNDGFVDSVYIFYAGQGEADGGPRESVWPYSWELVEEGVELIVDGVQFNTYGCSNELQSDKKMNGIGTFVHEFGHVLGLPDLYNTDNAYDFTTPGAWSVMDNGSYSNDSRTPPNMSSFERYSLGWLNPEELVYSGKYNLSALPDTNKAYIITSKENQDEFFMLENRQLQDWDAFLPWHGMLVWHINFNQTAWDENVVNNIRNRHGVMLVRADNFADSTTEQFDPFPGKLNNTELSSSTKPALKTWDNQDLKVTRIFNIEENEGEISFVIEALMEGSDAGIEKPLRNRPYYLDGNYINATERPLSVYDIAGRLIGVSSPGAPTYLNKGVYIVNGDKIIVR